ncbi:MAG TPA: folate-binding protein [Thiobacillaceae bacterium]|nr:folate-binding protein [Thiobacillaceae bacterium]
MIESWQQFLTQHGARIEHGVVLDFGNPQAEQEAAARATVMADLSQLGVLAFSGDDTGTFLQSQFTNDVRGLHPDTAQMNGFCSAKGRLLGNFLMWRNAGDYCLQLSGDIKDAVFKRLNMFILRAKVKGRDASDEAVRLVVAGPAAEAAVRSATGLMPDDAMKVAHNGQAVVVRLAHDKFVLSLAPGSAPAVWNTLQANARPVGAATWDWLRLIHGIPMIVAATVDQFVPQMVNFDLINSVSFQKGCYPGQEIVARTHYLGRLKRRMYLVHLDGDDAPAPGDNLYTTDMGDQASGMVVNTAPAPGGGFDLLAVAQIESINGGQALHWKSVEGPALTIKPLPYSIT